MRVWAIVLLACVARETRGQGGSTNETAAQEWVNQYNIDAQIVYYDYILAEWTYNTNITAYNSEVAANASSVAAAFDNQKADEANQWSYQDFTDTALAREMSKIGDKGYSVLPPTDYDSMTQARLRMETTYSTAKVCGRPGYISTECFPLDPDLELIMASSRDWDELLWAWEGWRNESGRKMPDDYQEFAGYLNQAAGLNGYADNGAYWRSWYEDPNFRQLCENMWLQLKPLYVELHAYVRRKLQEHYTGQTFPSSGHIPAHILGNMWAQSWSNVEDLVRPYPNRTGFDVTDEMVRQNYTTNKIFQTSEDFFVSLGMSPMNEPFWENSMLEKPTDGREVACHASAWDFLNQSDFRIKQCTGIDNEWLLTTHHEMGHVEYFMEYKDQPVNFRDGANPGFHEAIGDVISLSVTTPEHMASIGLMPPASGDNETDINFLMSEALKKIAFVPFGYLIDQWRWDLFADVFNRNEYNSNWWTARCDYQGVSPPVSRHAGDDFDAGAKYHVPANTPYIRYFVSYVLQYQFHKALCNASGNINPLHRCDIYNSTAAGTLLSDMMKLGSSEHWSVALEQLTGQTTMSAQPMADYFQPLRDWLVSENQGHPTGWTPACPAGSILP